MLAVCLLVIGCTPAIVPEAPLATRPSPSPQEAPKPALEVALAALPGAVPAPSEGAAGVAYPTGSLFAQRAVLPMPGGPRLLEPLVELLKRYPQQRWRFLVSARTGEGAAYDERLARQRRVLLERYLRSRAVALEQIEFTLVAQAEVPLRIVARQGAQPSSSEVGKE